MAKPISAQANCIPPRRAAHRNHSTSCRSAPGWIVLLPWLAADAATALTTSLDLDGLHRSDSVMHSRLAVSNKEWLDQWLYNLVVEIPDIDITKDGTHLMISDGRCTHFGISDIKTDVSGEQITIDVHGLKASCYLRWSAKFTILPTSSGSVNVTISNSHLGGPVALTDDGQEPPLPAAVAPGKCHAEIKVTDLHFSGGIASAIVELVKPLIEDILTDKLGKIICKELDSIIESKASPLIANTSADLRKFLRSTSKTNSTPPPLPAPQSDFADIGHNPGIDLLQTLSTQVFMNPFSPNNLNALISKALGPNGALSLDNTTMQGTLFPINETIVLKGLGQLNISIEAISVGGLDTWTKLNLATIDDQEISMSVALRKLQANASMKLMVIPSPDGPLHGETFEASFKVSLGLQRPSTRAALFAALNTSQLDTFSIDQLGCIGCAATGIYSVMETDASLHLPSVHVGLTPLVEDSLEKDVDTMITSSLELLLRHYAQAIDALANHLVLVLVRDQVNQGIDKALSDPGACQDPKDDYTNDFLHVGLSRVSLALTLVAIILTPLHILMHRRQKRSLAELPSAAGADDITCAIQAAAPCQQGGTSSQSRQPNCASTPELENAVVPMPRRDLSKQRDCEEAGVVAGVVHPENASRSVRSSAVDAETELQVQGRTHTELLNSQRERCPSADSQDSIRSKPWDCLAFHYRVHPAFRWGLPMMDLAMIALFIASNAGVGTSVHAALYADDQSMVTLPSIFNFSLISSIKDMWDSKVYGLAWLIILFSGVWPYIKLLLMQFCWFAPIWILKAKYRFSLLEFLDAWGKWSLVDTFVMVQFMVAFNFDLTPDDTEFDVVKSIFAEAGTSVRVQVYVSPDAGFHWFMIATMGSLIVGSVMTACHRYAHRLGEYSVSAVEGRRQRLCNVLRPPGFWKGKLFAWGPILATGCSIILTLAGIFLDTFSFGFEGLAGWVLGSDRVRSFSVMSLGLSIPSAAVSSSTLEAYWLMSCFLAFGVVFVLAYFSLLMVLWCAPLSPRLQTHFFVTCQVFSAWSGLDVFCVSVFACTLQISRFALAIVGNKCDGINSILQHSSLISDIPGERTCFNVDAKLCQGYWVLLAAALLSSVVGRVVIARCGAALCGSSGEGLAPEGARSPRIASIAQDA